MPGVVHAGAIRSTGMSASLGIARRVVDLLEQEGTLLGAERELPPLTDPAPAHGPWWRRTAEHVVAA